MVLNEIKDPLELKIIRREKEIENTIKQNIRTIENLKKNYGRSEREIIILRKNTMDPTHWLNQYERDIYNNIFLSMYGDEIYYKNSIGLYELIHVL
jgi:hypothetical protein